MRASYSCGIKSFSIINPATFLINFQIEKSLITNIMTELLVLAREDIRNGDCTGDIHVDIMDAVIVDGCCIVEFNHVPPTARAGSGAGSGERRGEGEKVPPSVSYLIALYRLYNPRSVGFDKLSHSESGCFLVITTDPRVSVCVSGKIRVSIPVQYADLLIVVLSKIIISGIMPYYPIKFI